MRRNELTVLVAGLVVAVLALDFLWSLTGVSMGSIAYGLVDLPAHLATCAIALCALTAVAEKAPARRFAIAALCASVAIDLDHVPGYLGDHVITGTLPRPYSHTALLAVALLALGLAARRPNLRSLSLGVAFGLGAHLFRDLATGPGVPLAWPVSSGIATLPYAVFAAALILAVVAVSTSRRPVSAGRFRLTAVSATLAVALASAVSAPKAEARTVSIGAYMAGIDRNPSLIDNFDAEVGRQAAIVITYKEWSQAPLVVDQLEGIWSHGAVPMVTWEPWGVRLNRIARGRYDGYIRNAARVAANWGKPLMIRFGQEMNGDWVSWGQQPTAYKEAWRHIVKVFRRAGADNVRWVWTPYVNNRGGRLPFVEYFPGEKWVDWAGVDAINWGNPFPWRTFRQIIGHSYDQLVQLTHKPLIIGETGSGELGGSKSSWLLRMLEQNVPRMRHVRALVFWSADDPQRGDLRVDSSPSALQAVRGALGRPLYLSSRAALLRTPSWLGG